MDAQQRNATLIAALLGNHPNVSQVFYPGSASHVNHAVHQAQARGGGAVLGFTAGSPEKAKSIAEQSEFFRISVSFGSVNSTISIPVKMSHASVPEELRGARSTPQDLLRLSIGIEDPDDLIADLNRCLED